MARRCPTCRDKLPKNGRCRRCEDQPPVAAKATAPIKSAGAADHGELREDRLDEEMCQAVREWESLCVASNNTQEVEGAKLARMIVLQLVPNPDLEKHGQAWVTDIVNPLLDKALAAAGSNHAPLLRAAAFRDRVAQRLEQSIRNASPDVGAQEAAKPSLPAQTAEPVQLAPVPPAPGRPALTTAHPEMRPEHSSGATVPLQDPITGDIQHRVRSVISTHWKFRSVHRDSLTSQTRLDRCFDYWEFADSDEVLTEVEDALGVLFPVDLVDRLLQTVGDVERFVAESLEFQASPSSQALARTSVAVDFDSFSEPDVYFLGPETTICRRTVKLDVDKAAWVSGIGAKRIVRQLRAQLPGWDIRLCSAFRRGWGHVLIRLRPAGVSDCDLHTILILLDNDWRDSSEFMKPRYVFRDRDDGDRKTANIRLRYNHRSRGGQAALAAGCLWGFLGGILIAGVIAMVGLFSNVQWLDQLPEPRLLPASETPWLRKTFSILEWSGLMALVLALLSWIKCKLRNWLLRRKFRAASDLRQSLMAAVRKLDVASALGLPIFEYPRGDIPARVLE